MIDHLLEKSRWDFSSKWLNIGFGEEIGIIEIEICILSWALKQLHLPQISYKQYIQWQP